MKHVYLFNYIHGFGYDPACISIHATRKSADKALRLHKEKVLEEERQELIEDFAEDVTEGIIETMLQEVMETGYLWEIEEKEVLE